MKKITLFIIIVSTFTGCKKWLEVQPSDLIVDTELFNNATGFRNALNGVYIQAARKDLYGKNLSWGLNSSYSQEYMLGRMGVEQQIAQDFDKDHANSKQIIDGIWSVAYNNITNCNKLLKEIDGLGEDKFIEGRSERNTIIGEATAMRALMHFEILRLYAPSPAQDVSGKYIPYVNTYPAKLNPPVASSQVIEQIISDLEKAQGLVAENDTLRNRDGLTNGLQTMLSGLGFTPPGGSFLPSGCTGSITWPFMLCWRACTSIRATLPKQSNPPNTCMKISARMEDRTGGSLQPKKIQPALTGTTNWPMIFCLLPMMETFLPTSTPAFIHRTGFLLMWTSGSPLPNAITVQPISRKCKRISLH